MQARNKSPIITTHPRLYKSQIGMIFEYKYHTWVCQGCDTVVLEEAKTQYFPYSEDKIKEDEHLPNWITAFSKEKIVWSSKLYPKRKRTDLEPKDFLQLNEKLAQIYKDIIEAFNNDSRVLCTIGLRALVEGICADKKVKVERNLYKSIENLEKYLSPNIVKNLHGFRFMGKMAAHELEAPDRFELRRAIEVIEYLLNFLYELEYKSKFLSEISNQETNN